MKLLLSSAGITNESIKKAFLNLLPRPANECKAVFIPTGADYLSEDKVWLVKDMMRFVDIGFKNFDIVDILAYDLEVATSRLEGADLIVFGGGETYPLMLDLHKRGYEDFFKQNKENFIYFGISAGSMIASGIMTFKEDADLYEERMIGDEISSGFGFVNFHIKPHWHSQYFLNVTEDKVAAIQETVSQPIYLLDDNSAVVVNEGDVEVVSEGVWRKFGE